ncbi:MAG: Mut7-C RNAse domain-containing protein [bacterium]
MKKVFFRFYEELNDHLPLLKRKVRFEVDYMLPSSVKDMIEAMGVPHTEIDLILVNGYSVGFDYIIKEEDNISVYPEFESFDVTKIQRLRPEPLRDPKFILDVHLGKLARYMRLLGFDTLYRNNYSDDEIVKIADDEKRTVLTRDKGILKRNDVNRGYWLRSTDAKKQIEEVINRFQLGVRIKEFSRCISCNGKLKSIEKENVLERIPPRVKLDYTEFFICADCDKIYWMGTHYDSMKVFVGQIKKDLGD